MKVCNASRWSKRTQACSACSRSLLHAPSRGTSSNNGVSAARKVSHVAHVAPAPRAWIDAHRSHVDVQRMRRCTLLCLPASTRHSCSTWPDYVSRSAPSAA